MKTRTHFAFRIDVWDDAANSIFEHVVGSEDFEVAVAAYFAACQRWPKAKITFVKLNGPITPGAICHPGRVGPTSGQTATGSSHSRT